MNTSHDKTKRLHQFAESHGIECLSEDYKNLVTLYRWRDQAGTEWQESFKSIRARAQRISPLVPKQPPGTYHKKNFLVYEEAKCLLAELDLSYSDWRSFSRSEKFPEGVPTNPYQYYRDKGWVDWYDFLSYSPSTSRAFEAAREFVRTLNLNNLHEWRQWANSDARPADIPVTPWCVYSDKGWINLRDFLGVEELVFRSFAAARDYVRALELGSTQEWWDLTKDPDFPADIPKQPHQYYKNTGWISFTDFLDLKQTRRKTENNRYASFSRAKKFARSLGLANARAWFAYVKEHGLPGDIPRNPYHFYKGAGWTSWPDFLKACK